MRSRGFNKTLRARILANHQEAVRALRQREGSLASVLKYEAEYDQNLPLVGLGCCPFDRLPLRLPFDAFGLAGLWWRPDRPRPRPEAVCKHFLLLSGALSLEGHAPEPGQYRSEPGPCCPFVYPHLLEHEGVVAVIAQRTIAPGHQAFAISYFKESPGAVLACALPPEWGLKFRFYQNEDGRRVWRGAERSLDFELSRWAEAGKLRWCKQVEPIPRLAKPQAECPFLPKTSPSPEEKRPQVIRMSE